MFTNVRSINQFAVLKTDVEPGSSSTKQDSRASDSNLSTTMPTTLKENKNNNKNKDKDKSNKSNMSIKERDDDEHLERPGKRVTDGPRSSIKTKPSSPIVMNSTISKSNLTSSSSSSLSHNQTPVMSPTTTLKSRKQNPPQPQVNHGNDTTTTERRPVVVDKKGKGQKIVTKKTDWEIPRKTLHGSIGFLVLYLHSLHPRTLFPLLSTLSTLLLIILSTDILRSHSPTLNVIYIRLFGPLMRESEERGWNGVVWYLIGCIWTLGVYPRDVAVVSVLTLSWSDTAASTIGRLFSPYTPRLPPHLPLIPSLHFSPRKSLAGFLAACLTGTLIGLSFWSHGKHLDGGHGPLWGSDRDLSWWAGERASEWRFLDQRWGKWSTALVLGLSGAVVEALDLGYDDNLTLPILTGAIVWTWLTVVSLLTT